MCRICDCPSLFYSMALVFQLSCYLNFSAGNWAGLSSGPACGHLPDWLDPNGHNSGYQRPAGEGGREDGSPGHEGLQGPVAHRHPGQTQAVRLGWSCFHSSVQHFVEQITSLIGLVIHYPVSQKQRAAPLEFVLRLRLIVIFGHLSAKPTLFHRR